ncbi:MAG: LptF/LptG family permease [Pseudomonadota bacterium]|nr:LptF/LptG family permease [Pseudomonadota bacterium]
MQINNFIFIKYIFLNILKPFFVISLVLTGIVWLSRSLKYIDLIINKGLSLSSYFWFVSLIAPKILALLLPLISFVAVIYTYQKLKGESELLVIETFGLSKLFLMVPAIIFGGIVALFLLLIEVYLSPNNYKTFKSFQSDLRNNFVISTLEAGSFHNPIMGLTVYIDKASKNGVVENILIHDTRNKEIESTILAKQGILKNFENLTKVKVFDGTRYVFNNKNKKTSILKFSKYEFQIITEKKETVRFKQVEERTIKELFYPDKKISKKIKNEFLAEAHKRLSSPFLVIFMSALAAFSILFGEFKRKVLVNKIILCSFIAVLIQALYISFMNKIVFSVYTFLLPYISLILLSLLPLLIIKYEYIVINFTNRFKSEFKF